MTNDIYLKFAENAGHRDSTILHHILEKAMTTGEAKFLDELPASNKDLAAKFDMTEKAVEDKLLELARRGLVVTSRKGQRFPRDLGTLHDNILSSEPQYIPDGIADLWMEFYRAGWWKELADALPGLPMPALRVIMALKAVPKGVNLLPHESAEEIIKVNKDLISVRRCCCRVGEQMAEGSVCTHATLTCTQFGRRAEYDLYRGSGTKISVDRALEIHHMATEAGLVPTVTNVAAADRLGFICYCCGDACLVLNPLIMAKKVAQGLSPSRFVVRVKNELCTGCGDCIPWCFFDAIEMKRVEGHGNPIAIITEEKCVGCGDCVLKCKPDAMVMELVRPPEFIPETLTGPSSITVH